MNNKQDTITIRVKLLSGRKAYMQVSIHQPVNSIRRMLADGKHLPQMGNYNLVFQGTILDNNKLISSYTPFLTNDSEILCVSRPDF